MLLRSNVHKADSVVTFADLVQVCLANVSAKPGRMRFAAIASVEDPQSDMA